MAFRFKHGDSSLQDGVRRIAVEQFKHAIGAVNDPMLAVPDTVHKVRKHCKKLRGLIRIVRPAFDDYAAENAAVRDAARTLSFIRDSDSLIEAYDSIASANGKQIDRSAFAAIREKLTDRQKEITETHGLEGRLFAFSDAMSEARERARTWRLKAQEFDDIAGGLEKTYERARKAMGRAQDARSAEAFHEWRKHVKYHWYHARLLSRVLPTSMKAHRKAAGALSDLLGDHHDLAVLRHTVETGPDAFGCVSDIKVLHCLITARQRALEAKAFPLGWRLLAEPADVLSGRWQTYWTDWRPEQPC